jgi:predicted dehydrogenase
VIGLGVGKTHLQHYQMLDGVEIAALADVNAQAAETLGAKYGAKPYTDAVAMMDGEKLDAVSICTPPKYHASLTVAAARHGLHVLCEKPMAPSLEDCDTMIEVTRKAGVTLMLGFKKRYSPAYSFLKDKEPEWGPPRIALCRYQLGPVAKGWFWDEADGGGPLVENTAHCFDVLRYLMGDAKTVYAETSNFFTKSGPGAGADIAEAVFTIRFQSGATAAIAAGAAGVWSYDRSERLMLSYDPANVEVYGRFDRPAEMRIIDRATDRAVTTVTTKSWPDDPSGFTGQFAAFVECVQGKAAPRASGIDGRRTLQLSLAVKQSGRTGKPVEISL